LQESMCCLLVKQGQVRDPVIVALNKLLPFVYLLPAVLRVDIAA